MRMLAKQRSKQFMMLVMAMGATVALFQNCGGFQSPAGSVTQSSAFATPVTLANTSWSTGCQVDTPTNQRFIQTLQFFQNGTALTYLNLLTWYSDSTCQSPTETDETHRSLTPISQSNLQAEFSAQMVMEIYTPKTQATVNNLNTSRTCTINTWALNQSQEVTGTSCAPRTSNNSKFVWSANSLTWIFNSQSSSPQTATLSRIN